MCRPHLDQAEPGRLPIAHANIRPPHTASLEHVKNVGMREDGGGKEKIWAKEHEQMHLEQRRCVCLFLLLRNND